MSAEMSAEMSKRDEPKVVDCEEMHDPDSFCLRHIGPRAKDIETMLKKVNASSLGEFVSEIVPKDIRVSEPLKVGRALSEREALDELHTIASKNKVFRSYIGNGFSDCVVPPVIQRNILENPSWYTQYTPYQAEIAQGRLEALLNFQTLTAELTGMELANASLLDEGSAAAEAMTFCSRIVGGDRNRFFVDSGCHPHVLDVVRTRAEPLGIELVIDSWTNASIDEQFFGALLQYPTTEGEIENYASFADKVHQAGALLAVTADLLSLALLKPPGEWGADVVVGNSQRFGVPLGCGGPHAAFFATKAEYRRDIPGRVVGVSKDASGRLAYRLALQTREQHIRRERATSNICTAQVLLAVMAGMYGVYHGPKGIKKIAERVHRLAALLAQQLKERELEVKHDAFFDTVVVEGAALSLAKVKKTALNKQLNLRYHDDGSVSATLDETTTAEDVADLIEVISGSEIDPSAVTAMFDTTESAIPSAFERTSAFLTHEVFNSYHSETELLRYIHRLASRDLSLTTSMIPLGSCTMKLNATAEMVPVTWKEFGGIHPFAPVEQKQGYQQLCSELEQMLADITGLAGVSLQPNAGSQGEYAGLLAIKAYHEKRGETHRNVCLIPMSAHGTNPASAVLAGLSVVPVKCDDSGNIDLDDLREKIAKHENNVSSLMITYPSTHGVFEEDVKEICSLVHQAGGQVYMDGANLNAQVGLTSPGEIGADVVHINLHKTFCIPHGGGGPGVGPIAVAAHLVPFLPGHVEQAVGGEDAIGAVASAPWGSASILVISWAYMKMMGSAGLTYATTVAMLNANYIAERLEQHFPVLYRGKRNRVAHECILDLRNFKRSVGIEVADVAKRLIDYGFHAPTVSFPVVETLMVEPTESESLEELDRFCDAMIAIRNEIREIEEGAADRENNVLKNAPHTAAAIAAEEWPHPYSRENAVYPAPWLKEHKFWPVVGRIDNVYGDRNLICSCVSMEEFS